MELVREMVCVRRMSANRFNGGTIMGNIKVGRYDNPSAVGWSGWIEDEERTWIAFIGLDGRPVFFLHRDPSTGGVIDPPSNLPADAGHA